MIQEQENKLYASPLVYGRTLEVDFRLLAYPSFLNEAQTGYLEILIKKTLYNPEKLIKDRSFFRWIIIKRKEFILIGVACAAFSVYDDDIKFTQDIQNRDLYVFLGYIIKEPTLEQIATFPMDITLFKQLYEKVVMRKWYEKNRHLNKIDNSTDEKIEINLIVDQLIYNDQTDVQLSYQINKTHVFPVSSNLYIWKKALSNVGGNVYVCLNQTEVSEKTTVGFSNISVLNYSNNNEFETVEWPAEVVIHNINPSSLKSHEKFKESIDIGNKAPESKNKSFFSKVVDFVDILINPSFTNETDTDSQKGSKEKPQSNSERILDNLPELNNKNQ